MPNGLNSRIGRSQIKFSLQTDSGIPAEPKVLPLAETFHQWVTHNVLPVTAKKINTAHTQRNAGLVNQAEKTAPRMATFDAFINTEGKNPGIVMNIGVAIFLQFQPGKKTVRKA